jgi:23S rRNA-/tRNA-specific pseudouridylate synthase
VNAQWTERYRDKYLLIVDKPAGLPTQSGRTPGPNLFDALRAEESYVALHHRLDTPVSGLVLFSLSRQVNAAITEAFRSHRVERRYQGFVLGSPPLDGIWDEPLDDRSARTHFERTGTNGRMSGLLIRLETGRKHQIRRHAATAGFPVIGDRRYGGAAGTLHPRVALHASDIRWTHPITGEPIQVTAPLPEDLLGLSSKTSNVPLA